LEFLSSQSSDFQKSFDLKQIEFQAVLDLTIAINKNKPEQGLYLILEEYLLEKLGINHFSLFFKDQEWRNSFGYGMMVKNTVSLSLLDNLLNASILSELSTELSEQNKHLHHVIPFFFDRELRGVILSGKPENFSYPYDVEAVALIQTLVSLMVMAIENQKLLAYRIRQEALRKEIEIARQVQRMLFPKILPDNEELKIYTTYMAHLDVSGDYYDFIQLSDQQFALCVADVSGKGMSAALLMSNFQACMRTLMMEKKELGPAVILMNTLLCENSNQERFITSFIAVIDKEKKEMTYVNSGHNPPCLIGLDGSLQQLPLGSTILGIFPTLPHLTIGKVSLTEEVLLVAYTDGLTEVEGQNEDEFGVERLEQYFIENRNEKLAVMHQRFLNRLSEFAGEKGFNDDITLLTARIKP
jgi:sigma-B regulation protein RsbU (phosphoserine phosphatase)